MCKYSGHNHPVISITIFQVRSNHFQFYLFSYFSLIISVGIVEQNKKKQNRNQARSYGEKLAFTETEAPIITINNSNWVKIVRKNVCGRKPSLTIDSNYNNAMRIIENECTNSHTPIWYEQTETHTQYTHVFVYIFHMHICCWNNWTIDRRRRKNINDSKKIQNNNNIDSMRCWLHDDGCVSAQWNNNNNNNNNTICTAVHINQHDWTRFSI